MITKEQVQEIIERLLAEIEEEDIGVSLFSTYYQVDDELNFFREEDRGQVLKILKKLVEDSRRHKKMLEKIISRLEKYSHEK